MTNKLPYKTLISLAIAGIGLLAITAVPSLAHLDEETKENSSDNFTHCWETSNQDYQTHYQWMAQHGPMMGTGGHGSGGWRQR